MEQVCISIKSEYWHSILAGRKKLELRKSFPTRLRFSPFNVLVHVSGTDCIAGQFTCAGIREYVPQDYAQAAYEAMVNTEFIHNYAKGRKLYGWQVTNPQEFTACRKLEEYGISRAPQSWCYID